jgi:uncharacterized membrane protein
MKRYGLIVLFCLLGISSLFADKKYSIENVRIMAKLLPDGSMQVHEHRLYNFTGSFSYAYRTFVKGKGIRYDNFFVSEAGNDYWPDEGKKPGSFRVEDKGDELVLYWYYQARDTKRTFTVQYRVHDAVHVHPDGAELYYQFIGSDFDRAQNNVTLRVEPPPGLKQADVLQWLHGPLWAESRTEADGSIVAACDRLPAKTLLELHALYPMAAFAGAPTDDKNVREEVLAAEAKSANEANQMREKEIVRREQRAHLKELAPPIVFTLAGIAVALYWMLFAGAGPRPAKSSGLSMVSDPPDQTPPALVGYLLNTRMTTGNDLVATLMDLAQRGFLQFVEEKRQGSGLFSKGEKTIYALVLQRTVWNQKQHELLDFERELIDFVFNQVLGQRDRVEMDELKKQPNKMRRFFVKWQKQVKAVADQREYYDRLSVRNMYYGMIVSGVLLILGLAAFPFIEVWGLVPVITAVLIFIGSILILHRTPEGQRLYERWRGVKRYLKKYQFESTDRTQLLRNVDRYVIYGLVFGLYKKHYLKLTAAVPGGQQHVYFPWYMNSSGAWGDGSPAAFGAAFGSMVTTMSSASGLGGGASAGSGAGAGGGGGGAG